MVDWYKDRVFYQIWPRSFKDGNDDGIGDLQGVLEKLDYLADLGVGGIWFSPLYPSPNADYGYDIADYRDISPEYGTLDLFKQVLAEAHARDMKVIMDLVVNHTSDEHEWFRSSVDSASPYHDYYFWRPGRGANGDTPPNNWLSLFEGGAWERNPQTGEYYLHVFARKQPDLNHDNPRVRQEIKEIMRFWLDMGVDGFREDVINFLSKAEGLPNGFPLPTATGYSKYINGPRIHEYLQEYRQVLDEYDCFVVGEMPQTGPQKALEYLAGPHPDLDMAFSFDHMTADCFMADFIQTGFKLRKMKRAMTAWQNALNGRSWNALYIENHDHPRIISRYGSETYRTESGKMLANMYMLQQGTAFVYQGQEIGMLNTRLESIDDYKDVSVKNSYKVARGLHISERKCMELAVASTRDNARTPMQWDAGHAAGFTTGEPWFAVNPNYREINVAAEQADSGSIWHHYKRLIAFKRENEVAKYGDYTEYYADSRKLYVYGRALGDRRLLVVNSFVEEPVSFKAPEGFDLDRGEPILCNYGDVETRDNGFETRPYESRVYLFG